MVRRALPSGQRDRARAGAAAIAFQLALGYALVSGLGVDLTRRSERPLSVFAVAPPPPVRKEPPPPPPTRDDAPDGSPAPPSLRATPKPIVSPPPIIPLPPAPVLAAPIAGEGDAASAGASDLRGPGTGAGGAGTGLGGGGTGAGEGVRSRQIAGRIRNSDYPRGARRSGAQGSVIVDIHIDPRGRVSRCDIVSSSGDADLDLGTCDLIRNRFRYAPARNAEGEPVADLRTWKQDWWLERRRPEPTSYKAQLR